MERELGRRLRVSWAASLLLLGLGTVAAAQTVRTGNIAGTLTDESGGVLPGVSITLTSPALQVPQVATVSGARGEYSFGELPPGTFKVTYELQGFATLVREGIVLTTGFAARVDVALKVASLGETITVSGEAPVVDVTNTRGGASVSKELLQALPNAADYQDTLLLVPGAQVVGPPLNGETGFRGNTSAFKSYGLTGQQTQTIEGIMMTGNEQPDFTAAEELDAKTFGNSAEISFPGAVTQLIIKSGGNQFSGRYGINGATQATQGSNIDARLRAQGVTSGDAPLYYWNGTADIGGRIVPNKLWFYGSLFELKNERTAPGYSSDAGPDRIYGTADDTEGKIPGEQRNRLAKGSYQMTPNQRLIGFYSFNLQVEPQVTASRLNPFENTPHFTEDSRQTKIEWESTFSNKLVANLMLARGWYRVDYYNNSNNPSSTNLNTGLSLGGSWQTYSNIWRVPSRVQLNGAVTYAPGPSKTGTHQLKAGFNMWWGRNELGSYIPQSGPYQMVFDTIGGVPNTPVQLLTRNYPTDGLSGFDTLGAFVSDTWSPTSRLTLNLGLRSEHQWAFIPPQTKVQGTFGSAGTFPALDAGKWTTFAPRVGAAFDVTGNGKTLLKATYGVYYFNLGGIFSDFAQAYNQNTIVTTTYRWRDLNGDKLYQPGEVNLDPNGSDFLSVAGASNNVQNSNLKIPHQNEVTASVERDLGHNISVRGLYVYKAAVQQTATVNILRPYSAYNRVYTRRDPGADGILNNADDGGMITINDYDPAFAGSRFVSNQLQNSPLTDTFNNYEISMNRRKAGKWYATTSLVATKNHKQITLIHQSPNDDRFALDETWELSYRLGAGYDLPWGLQASTLTQIYNGLPSVRTVLFRSADPDRGPSFASSTSINLPVEAFGAEKGAIREVVNVRLSKIMSLGSRRRLELDADGTNVLNGNVPWGGITSGNGVGQIYASGPTYGNVTRLQQPRALRLGAVFSF